MFSNFMPNTLELHSIYYFAMGKLYQILFKICFLTKIRYLIFNVLHFSSL